jgi:predicted ATPase
MITASLGPQPHLLPFRSLYLDVLVWVPWALWCRGYPERALNVGRAALAVAPALLNEFFIVLSLSEGLCFTQQLGRDVDALQRTLGELLPLTAKESGQPRLRPYATLFFGWVHAQGGLLEQGIAEFRRGLAEWSAYYGMLRPYWRGYLAEALARAGRVEEGLQTLAEALEQAERTGEGFSLAELHRLKGELLLQRGAPEGEAEACFRRAIAVARGQEAKSWELRATLSLARLWFAKGKREEAQQILSAIYGWFTEGFDTPDLQEARALLAELAAEGGDARGDK